MDDQINAVKEGEYTYTATSKVKQLKVGSAPAQTIDYTYNQRDWLTNINNLGDGTRKFRQEITYNSGSLNGTAPYNGNISTIKYFTTSLLGMAFSYTYDAANRLTGAFTYWDDGGFYEDWGAYGLSSIAYDGAGNLQGMIRYGWNSGVMDQLSYVYQSGKNRLDYISDGIASGNYGNDIDNQLSGNYGYDGNGNITRDNGSGITYVAYNIRNLPTTLSRNSQNYNYYYDASDQRAYSTGSQKFYIQGADGKTEAVVDFYVSALITHNIWGNDLIGQVKRNHPTLTRYYHLKDHLGSVRVTVDASGNAVAYDDFDPWGMTMDQRSYNAGLADARYKFTSKERDTETGLDYFGARYYDARIGRWMSVDPLADKYPSLSIYNYVSNNPLRLYDPDGRGFGDFIKKIAEAVKYNVTVGLQMGGEISLAGKGLKLHGNAISTSIISGDFYNKPEILNGEISQGGGARLGAIGVGVEETISGTTVTETREERGFISTTASNSKTTTVEAGLGPGSVGKEITETRTMSLSGRVESIRKEETTLGAKGDFKVKGALGVGVEIKVDISKLKEALKSLKE